ncbi:hypothetical protein EIP91_012257 [Steccherinum ochraceum]|uniref:F-box domain-containing protein n=1 Tax=Steccherinum ochraceum TaxID=92696 RepID=A0A4R0RGL8_9APHY|nr:hypothetical protein EIP91_012257 [Steccherinum ochraceum]
MLTTPTLWDTIIIRNSARNTKQQVKSQVAAFLSRSGSCSLDVSIVDGRDWLHLFKGHLNRVRGLRVSGKSGQLKKRLPSSAPHLESLRIMMSLEGTDGEYYAPAQASMPAVFHKDAPSLRRLWVRNIGHWKNRALSFTNLTRLCLEGAVDEVNFPRGSPTNYLDFLHLLQNSPQLEVLLLRSPTQWIPRIAAQGAFSDVVVKLPCLQTYSVSDASAVDVAALYANLGLPRGLCMSLHDIGEPEIEDVELFWDLFPKRGAVHNAQVFEEITRVEITVGMDYGDTITVNGAGPSGAINIELPVEDPEEENDVDVLDLCIRSISWWPLNELWFRTIQMWDDGAGASTTANPAVWRGLRASSTLQKLVFIHSQELDNFLSSVRSKRGSTDETAAYPNLQQIWISDESAEDLADVCEALFASLVMYRGETPPALREIYLQVSASPLSKDVVLLTPRLTKAISDLRKRFVVHFADDEAASLRWEYGIELPAWSKESLNFGTGHSCKWWPEWKPWTRSQEELEDDMVPDEEDEEYMYASF